MINFEKAVNELIKNRDKIPDRFWVKTDGQTYDVIWLLNRQKPSVEASYAFDEERLGITREGKIIWGFDSGCSCPSPWSQEDFGDSSYNVKTWKEFIIDIESLKGFDKGWEDDSLSDCKDFLLIFAKKPVVEDVLKIRNAELKSYVINRIGYEKIRDGLNAKVIHTDGDSELLKIKEDVFVKVKDSSTDRQYLLSVPDNMERCKQAIAWTFSMKEEEYNPIIET